MVKTARAEGPPKSIFAPLRLVVFRRIWAASLLSNFGLLIMGVGAAWSMTQMTASANMVALVQTASMLPVALVSLAAGAIADMYDRRRVALVALSIGMSGALAMTCLALANALTPIVLLALCFAIGSSMALFGPAWQASVSEQVPSEDLAAAVALNGISYNIARSFGPAIGGVIVATVGSAAAFGANAVLYVPLLIVLYLWRRPIVPSRLPPERLGARDHLGHPLCREFSADPRRARPHLGHRHCRQRDPGADAADRARSVARRRTTLRPPARGLSVWAP